MYEDLILDKKSIVEGEYGVDWKTYSKMKSSKVMQNLVPLEFTYGYAITCHKSQGSEWDKVLIYEEKFPFVKEEHKKWLYTAVTRGAQKVVLVRP
jgi:ATP-dependent exoDNAse (exonuclease V) alpha subunit